MLPLPLIEVPAVGKGGGQRRRGAGRRAIVRLANGALSALNLLLGFDSQPGDPRCSFHEAVRAEALQRAEFFWPDGFDADASSIDVYHRSDESSLRELLRGRSVYDVSRSGCSV